MIRWFLPSTVRFFLRCGIGMVIVASAIYMDRRNKISALEISQARLAEHEKALRNRDEVISQLRRAAEKHAAQIAALDRRKSAIAAVRYDRSSLLETLRHDIANVDHWAQHTLPADVVRLYTRPTLNGADGYIHARLRASDPTRDAGDDAPH